ncbi:MAG: hypothetical protein JSS99_08340 [Actinobacteria bacterium]|nr:hypothetical protein [Actinomycetota bacterium]
MSILLGTCLLAVPLLLHAGMVVGVYAEPQRTFGRDRAPTLRRSFRAAPLWLAAFGLVLFAVAPHTRQDAFYVVLLLLALLGAATMRRRLFAVYEDIASNYLDATDWSLPAPPGRRWRYEMKASFADDPEYVDSLVLELIRRCTTYEEFVAEIRRGRFEQKYNDVIDKRYWGRIFPTVRDLAQRVVLEEVMTSRGRRSPEKPPEEIFAELRALAQQGDALLLMDRWQHYWCLRNLDLVDKVLERSYGGLAELGVVAGAMTIGLTVAIFSSGLSAETALRSEAAGALAWLVVACGGASLLMISLFRGTGTFSIAHPSRGRHYDPIWTAITRLGILAFTLSFLVYGIGSPFMLMPDVLDHFRFNTGFVLFSAFSLAFCLAVFVNHLVGTHMLMVGSRENALTRLERMIDGTDPNDPRRSVYFERFREARGFGVWPIRGSTIASLIAGIGFPIAVQVILLYSGLKR